MEFFFIVCWLIIITASVCTFTNYLNRQLVKANFYLNLAIFALLALLSIFVLVELTGTD